jgi:dTDP-4-amino-4,6-dideoxygalactose transaminase
MKVPLLDLRAQYAPLRAEIEAALREVCDSQQFILGPRVERLEREIAEYSRCRYAIGVSSGTDALLVALMALGVGSGDAVLTTAFSFFATAGAIARLGARPLFCDVDASDFNLSPESVQRFISERCEMTREGLRERETGARIKVLLPVHLYGQMADMDAFMSIAGRYGLKVVEDAAQAIGAETADGRRAGSVGDIGCLSFFPTKNLGAFGDAGMCTTNDPAMADRLKRLRVHGSEQRYFHVEVGGNFRLDEIQAAVLLIKLRELDRWTMARQTNAERYQWGLVRAGLLDFVKLPENVRGGRHVFNQYVIRAQHRDELKAALAAAEIGSEIYYPLPLHLQECFAGAAQHRACLSAAEAAAEEVLALPIYPELAEQAIDRVVGEIANFYR